METNCFRLAERFVGLSEVSGQVDNPQIVAMLRLDASWPEHDEVPWCSALVDYVSWLLNVPRAHSLRARSWLRVGRPIDLLEARAENDVVVLSRGANAPGPDTLAAPGHVGFFAGLGHDALEPTVWILGGNQNDSVSISEYAQSRILGVRRLV